MLPRAVRAFGCRVPYGMCPYGMFSLPPGENVHTGLKGLALVLLVSICIRHDELCGVHSPMSYLQMPRNDLFRREVEK